MTKNIVGDQNPGGEGGKEEKVDAPVPKYLM